MDGLHCLWEESHVMLIMQACAHTIPVRYRYGCSEVRGKGLLKKIPVLYQRWQDKEISFFGLLEGKW